jgi:chromosome segregation ATPase
MSSALIDLLKDIPLSSVLKEKVASFEAKAAELETERDILHGKVRNSENVIYELKQEIDDLKRKLAEATTPPPRLDEKGEQLLKAIAEHKDMRFSIFNFQQRLPLTKVELDYYWEELRERKFITSKDNINHTMTQTGRRYSMDHLSE